MALELVDFTISSGDSMTLYFTIYDTNDVLIDLSTATIEYGARKYSEITGDSVLLYTTLSGITVTGTGICSVEILAADTVDLLGKYSHELRVTDSDGSKFTVFPKTEKSAINGYGTFIVVKSII